MGGREEILRIKTTSTRCQTFHLRNSLLFILYYLFCRSRTLLVKVNTNRKTFCISIGLFQLTVGFHVLHFLLRIISCYMETNSSEDTTLLMRKGWFDLVNAINAVNSKIIAAQGSLHGGNRDVYIIICNALFII